MWLFVYAITGIVIWLAIDAVKHAVTRLQQQVESLGRLEPLVAALQRRVEVLEAAGAGPARVATVFIPAPVPLSTFVEAPIRVAPQAPTASRVEPPEASPEDLPRVAVVPAPADEGWEVVVGTSWLNKIGVFIFVLGLALLVGYSFTRIGPAGRVTIAYLISAGMLGTGVWLEQRHGFKTYAYGLVAGGWAAVYFTTYAMHAVPAARLIDSDLVGTLALVVVAAAMIAHSIRYRAESLTAMAYVVGFGTLTLTPLSGFSFVASVPLTVSLVVVAYRFGWDRMVLVGLVSTYALFTIRENLFSNAWLDPQSASRYLALGVYWFMFEVADVARLRNAAVGTAPMPLVAVNAAAFAGATLLQAPEDPALLTNLFGAMGVAYLASAVTRRLLIPTAIPAAGEDATVRFTSSHAALAISVALMCWLLHRRFSGVRETLALTFQAEVLLAAGLAVRDRWVRSMSSATLLAAFAVAGWFALDFSQPLRSWPWPVRVSTPPLALVAASLIVNREWIDRRRAAISIAEGLYPWLAFMAVAFIVARECAPAWRGVGGLVVSLILLEAGLRRRREYFGQAVLAAMVSSVSVLGRFLPIPGNEASSILIWQVVPAASLLAYGFAVRCALFLGTQPQRNRSIDLAVTATSSAGAALLAVLEWRVVPEAWVPVAWAVTGAGLVAVGYLINRPEQRWLGYTLAGVAAGAVGIPLWQSAPGSSTPLFAAALVGAALYGISGGTRGLSRSAGGRDEDTAAVVVSSSLATLLVVLIEWRSVPADRLALAWSTSAAVLLAIGFWRHAAGDLRAQAAVLLAIGIGREATTLLDGTTGSLVWAWAEVILVYALALGSRILSRRAAADPPAPADETMRVALLFAGALLLTLVVHAQVTPGWLVPVWGMEGMALLLSGFFLHDRVLRLSGLGLLFLCLARLGYDIRSLDALGRIISFVVLGLVLLAVSWTYTKFRDQMKRWL